MTPEAIALVESHLTLIEPIARQVVRSVPYPLDFDELKSLASCALVEAAERWKDYCERNGFDVEALDYFVAYATRRMRGACIESLRQADWVKRQARSRAKRLQAVGMGTSNLTDEELAYRADMTVAEVRATRQAVANSPVSFDADGEHGAGTLMVLSPQDVEGTAFERTAMHAMVTVLGRLDPQTRVVLVLHYYLNKELQDVAEEMEISEARASLLHSAGVLSVLDELRELASERVLEAAC